MIWLFAVGIAGLLAGYHIGRSFGRETQRFTAAGIIAGIAADLLKTRLLDREYINRVAALRAEVEAGAEVYPGSRDLVREWESARQELKQIDYKEPSVQKEWVEIAQSIYWQTFWKTRDAWQSNFNS